MKDVKADEGSVRLRSATTISFSPAVDRMREYEQPWDQQRQPNC